MNTSEGGWLLPARILPLLLLALAVVAGCHPDEGEIPRYTREEIRTLEEEAGQGRADSAYLRAVIEQQGLGLPVNENGAIAWYEKAIALGHGEADIALGLLQLNREGADKNAVEAARWFRRAADRGRADAQYYLAGLHHRGEGVERDDVQALKWLLLASRGQPRVKEAPVEAAELAKALTPEKAAEAGRLADAFSPAATNPPSAGLHPHR